MDAPITPTIPPALDNPKLGPEDREPMERAIRLARRGWGSVHPNPMVGCVLMKGGTTIAEGWHREFGGPHAEIDALTRAGPAAEGATAYISLEPCNHSGKTPPCTRALRAAGVTRVVYAARDLGEAAGGGEELTRQGLEVVGPTHPVAFTRGENPAFFAMTGASFPWVSLKLAVSLDGKIAAVQGVRTDITNGETRSWTHRLRSGFDAIFVGAETARVDDPLLTVREGPSPRVQPRRVIADPRATLSPQARILSDNGPPVIVLHTSNAPPDRVAALEAAGALTQLVTSGPDGLDLPSALTVLSECGIGSVLCEGGGRLASSLLDAGLVGRIILLVAPRIVGPLGVPAFPLAGREWGDGEWQWVPTESGPAHDGLCIFDRIRA